MLGAFFMATDYVTSPITDKGKIVFGIILGLLTGLFRLYGPNAEGVSYAIIIGNILVPLIEKVTMPKAFGRENAKRIGARRIDAKKAGTKRIGAKRAGAHGSNPSQEKEAGKAKGKGKSKKTKGNDNIGDKSEKEGGGRNG